MIAADRPPAGVRAGAGAVGSPRLPVTDPSPDRSTYSPELRTAVVLTGTGVDGAYHAGVLRGLAEAGVKIDLVAGHGIGAVGAVFAALDGGARLWDASGLWRRAAVSGLYGWRTTLRISGWSLAAAAAVILAPLAVLALGLLVYGAALVLESFGSGTAARVASGYADLVATAFGPTALPAWLPRLALLIVLLLAGAIAVAAAVNIRSLPARRRHRGGFWWAALAAPMGDGGAAAYFRAGLWELIRGGAKIRQPDAKDLGRRYAELLADNLGQPGFRELLIVVHDLDARRDLVFALLGQEERRPFFLRKPAYGGERRSAEAFDLAGVARDQSLPALAAALSIPGLTDPVLMLFPLESHWRGEAHRLCDRPGALGRVLEEVAAAGARQAIVVTAAPELGGPHALSTRGATPRARVGDFLAAAQAAGVRDAVLASADLFEGLFVIRPAHNPVGPLDLGGTFDARSDRWHGVGELLDRGYEDAHRQFVEPVLAASGDALAGTRAVVKGAS
jgi:hypothetical protein